MAWTVGEAFAEFEQILLPTTAQNQAVQPKINTAHGYLAKTFHTSSDMPLRHTKLIGSAAHGTLIRPVGDFDLMAVFNDPRNLYATTYANNSQAFIRRVRAAFDGCRVETIGVRGQAVRLFYQTGAHIDVAPVFSWTAGGYILPAGDGTWIRTNPDTQHSWFQQENQRLNYNLLPLIRLLKRWNNVHGSPLKPYHLSVMVARIFTSLGPDRADAVAKFFSAAPHYLDVHDPAGHSGNLASNLTLLGSANLATRLSNATARASSAIAASQRGDHREAIRLWAIEFGSEFPSYG